jgi:hypothetical protein
MLVQQIADIVNETTREILGEESIQLEDLSNLVDIGDTINNLSSSAYENYIRSLIDHIGKVVFVNRPYSGGAPSVLMDSWEYGSILEKITAQMPDATENESWELEDGEVYEQDRFTAPRASAKFYDSLTTFEIPMSFAERQSRSAFDNATQLNAFMSMIETSIYNSQSVKTDSIVMRTINNAILQTVSSAFGATAFNAGTTVRAVNLLYEYNQAHPTATLSSLDAAMATPEFIRYAAFIMSMYEARLRKMSTLFNAGAQPRFTPNDRLHFVMLDMFAKAADIYNQSDTFHDNFTALPNAETVPYWQGSGTDYATDSITQIKGTIKGASGNANVTVNGVIGVMFDRDALGVCNKNQRVTTHYNARAEFFNNWYKVDSMQFNDFNENCVVFFADVESN